MLEELKNQLPNIYKVFMQEQQELQSKYAEKTPEFARGWNSLIALQEQIINTVVVFIKVVDAKILKKDFIEKLSITGEIEFSFPPALLKIIKDQKLFEAIFNDMRIQNQRVLKKYKVDGVLKFEWQLKSSPSLFVVLRLKELNDEILMASGIKEYEEALKQKDEPVVEEIEPSEMSEEDRLKKYANEIFESVRIFEKDVLQVSSKSEKEFLAKQIFKEIVFNSDAKEKLNFAFLDSYDNFKMQNVIEAIKNVLKDESRAYLETVPNMPKDIINEIMSSKKCDEFIESMALGYERKYSDILKDVIADSFLECAGSGATMTQIPSIIHEAVKGTRVYKPILEINKGSSVATKPDQLWMRVKQAKIEREKALKEEKATLDGYAKKVNGIKKNIVAIRKAFNMSLSSLKKYDASLLCDIALNEDGEHSEEKRILQFTPKGEVALALIEMVDRGRRGARTPGQKEDFAKALKFYNNLNVNNTEQALKEKLREYNEQLPIVEEKLNNTTEKYEELEGKGLEIYDQTLKLMKETIMQNLGKKRE